MSQRNPISKSQFAWTSFQSGIPFSFSSLAHSSLRGESGYPVCQNNDGIFWPSNHCHAPSLRRPTNALITRLEWRLLILVRLLAMSFLFLSESTTARSPPWYIQYVRAWSHVLKTFPANTRKQVSSAWDQPLSHFDPENNGNVLRLATRYRSR